MFLKKKNVRLYFNVCLITQTVSNRKCIHIKLPLNFRNGDPHKWIIIFAGPWHQMFEPPWYRLGY